MQNRLTTIGLSLAFLAPGANSAFAASVPTMNQPDNGFYEGADPEWAAAHSTDIRSTADHRQYHREGVQAHLLWHAEHRSAQGTVAYAALHRISHQERNMLHRLFHTGPLTP